MKKHTSQVLIAVVCVLLGFMLSHQFKLLSIRGKTYSEGGKVSNYYDITTENDQLKRVKEDIERENNNVLSHLKKYEVDATNNDTLTIDTKKQLDDSRVLLGMKDVQGPGVIIYLNPKSSIFNNNASRYINYKEIVYIINELYFAGAEAVSVNDNRIVLQSVIKSSSNNEYILVNDDQISPKKRIVINVIGDKGQLADALNFPLVLDYLALTNYDIKIEKSDQIKVLKYNKPYKDEFLKPVNK